jgi:hypothetical protein
VRNINPYLTFYYESSLSGERIFSKNCRYSVRSRTSVGEFRRKRKLYKKILAHDHAEAFLLYAQLMKTADQSYDYQLLTGNWQPLKF